jgi:tungstate transport system substrate-binding protein
MRRTIVITITAAVTLLIMAGSLPAAQRLKLSTTTSTDNTGLLEYLLPAFEKDFGYDVDVIAVGTGKALKLAENGDVDVTMVHAPSKEVAFVDAGFGVNRREVMANYFIIVGPADDPAGVASAADAGAAFKAVADGGYAFISRGDNSGTHVKEQSIWDSLGADTGGSWYIESGRGMGDTLIMTDEKIGYTICDSGTFLKFQEKVDLKILFMKQSDLLYNPYAVIAVNPARWPEAEYLGAMQFIGWITSPAAQKLIGDFKDKNGNVLFYPLAVKGTDQKM